MGDKVVLLFFFFEIANFLTNRVVLSLILEELEELLFFCQLVIFRVEIYERLPPLDESLLEAFLLLHLLD